MPNEAHFEETVHGRVAQGDGWFVANARDSRWYHAPGRGAFCDFEGDQDFRQVGVNIQFLEPGEAMAMYHWEADQEGFLVLSGEALLVVEGEERPLRAWDFFHCPPGTRHTIVGAGNGPCIVLAIGGRAHDGQPDWGGYSVDSVAQRHNAGVESETTVGAEAYATVQPRDPTRYRDGWLPADR